MQFGVVLHVSANYAKWDTFLAKAKKAEARAPDIMFYFRGVSSQSNTS